MEENSVLIVHDDASILTALRMTLEGSSSVYIAANGSEAIRFFHEKEPVAVLLDIGLPDTSGIQLIGQIKILEPEEDRRLRDKGEGREQAIDRHLPGPCPPHRKT
jgi:DNA-binding response OmpR family regulator